MSAQLGGASGGRPDDEVLVIRAEQAGTASHAIEASQHASAEAKTAVELADEAAKLAKDAKSQADAANKEAARALAASAKAAGFAYVTAQAAADAGNAAAQVAKPANDAIQLGSPNIDTDSAAGLVVLTGQASKSIGEQQQAVADAHAKNAAAEAQAAKNIADQAAGAKIATATFRHATERLVDIDVADGGKLTSTAGHKFFVAERGWRSVSELRVGDRLRTPDGPVRAVTALHDRQGLDASTVYDLTVNGPHTFFVRTAGVRPQDVLVHNCLNIVADEGKNGAHTLSEHVLDDQAARAKAERDGIATVWNDQDTAVRCINGAFQQWLQRSPKNGKKLTDWITAQRKKPKSDIFGPRYDLFPIEWELRGEGSLGKIWRKGATTPDNAGNKVSINIKAVRGKAHPGDPDANVPNNFVIYTAYPK